MRAATALLLLLLLAAPGAGDDRVAPGGALEVRERVHDAGNVDRDWSVRHAFLLRNTSTEAVAIRAKPG